MAVGQQGVVGDGRRAHEGPPFALNLGTRPRAPRPLPSERGSGHSPQAWNLST
ncbi:Hypothetical protein AA314_00683 [Archangium gephyra]|uniref:Uncharacterized protein n=1 Tax=Archangium gephyra TaxID=48 RepID=A0AAC8TAP2_9BACT|nr:Hypothetical protein AA314_00683 [Archangium gephyra]